MDHQEAEKLANEIFGRPTNMWSFGLRIYVNYVANVIPICAELIISCVVDWIEAGSPEDSEGIYNLCDKFTQSLK